MSSRDEIRAEIASAIRELGLLDTDWRELPEAEAIAVMRSLETTFTRESGRRWWWEVFSRPFACRVFEDGHGYERLPLIAPDPLERIWFVPGSDEDCEPVVYEMAVSTARDVIGECSSYEYFIADKGGSWLITESHRDAIYAVGDAVRERLDSVG